jgi:hypothetical protein
LGVVVCWCLVFGILKFQTPKPQSVGPTFLSLFHNSGVVVWWCSKFVIAETRLTSVFPQNCRNMVGIICYMNKSNTMRNVLVELMEYLHPV